MPRKLWKAMVPYTSLETKKNALVTKPITVNNTIKPTVLNGGRKEHPADREDEGQLRSASLFGAHPAPDPGRGEVLTARKMLYGIKRRVESR
jgi:hypothetical protein